MIIGERKNFLRNLISQDVKDALRSEAFISRIEDYLILKFVNFITVNDLTSNMNGKGNKLVDELILCFSQDSKCLKDVLLPLYSLADEIRSSNETEEINSKVNSLEDSLFIKFDEFLDHLLKEGAFSQVKKDYFI